MSSKLVAMGFPMSIASSTQPTTQLPQGHFQQSHLYSFDLPVTAKHKSGNKTDSISFQIHASSNLLGFFTTLQVLKLLLHRHNLSLQRNTYLVLKAGEGTIKVAEHSLNKFRHIFQNKETCLTLIVTGKLNQGNIVRIPSTQCKNMLSGNSAVTLNSIAITKLSHDMGPWERFCYKKSSVLVLRQQGLLHRTSQSSQIKGSSWVTDEKSV